MYSLKPASESMKQLSLSTSHMAKWVLPFFLMLLLPYEASAIDIKGKKDKTIIDGICYSLNAKKETAIVLKSAEPYSGDIVIPEKIEADSLTYYVEEIATSAFEKSTGMTSVVIPKTVSKIGARAFAGCSSLKAVELPKSVEELATQLFADCSSLPA